MKIDKNLGEVFDLAAEDFSYARQDTITKDNKVVPPEDAKLDHDFNTTRENLHTLLSTGTDALEEMMEIARQSESFKDFEIVNEMLRNLSEINLRLLELNEKHRKLLPQASKEDLAKKEITNNTAIFVGTNSDLNKYIDNLIKEKK